jgi:PPOX class probable F420-dependent enzyme
MPRVDVRLSPDEVRAYLAARHTGALATVGRGGFPHQVAMWYVPEPDRVLMWTYRRSQKAANLYRDRRASLLVEDGDTYGTLRGVLVQGEAQLLEDLEVVTEIGNRLRERYAGEGDQDLETARAGVAAQAPRRVGIALPLTRVISWDHRKLG